MERVCYADDLPVVYEGFNSREVQQEFQKEEVTSSFLPDSAETWYKIGKSQTIYAWLVKEKSPLPRYSLWPCYLRTDSDFLLWWIGMSFNMQSQYVGDRLKFI